ncbi:GAF domain-containing protein [Nitrospirillum sp. BR 11828]|uniref:GAF domain-containing protein n=1 Tax=Nitrospirillum sp. BR 11828 TaxID=3104325 RepID=UPI002ACAADA2|nr:GAF domain-containing protein [Nitrospirillum sp. BR 11828]MDZ5645987.1 GAF domain-containing protein [Nitrospirillum sp. BR 11828]
MFQARTCDTPRDKATLYSDLALDLTGLLTDERDAIANAANLSALLFTTLPDLNWAGFYFMRNAAPKTLDGDNMGGTRELVLGPFQGKPACVRIAVGRGVCGTAVEKRQSVLVEDVHAFPGHIACDAASRSELVVPLMLDGQVLGVIDLDSPNPARFDAEDQAGVEALAALFVAGSDWPL